MSSEIQAGKKLTSDTISSILSMIKDKHVRTLTPAALTEHKAVQLQQPISAAERSVLIGHLGDEMHDGHWVCICSGNNSISIFDPMNSMNDQKDDPRLTSIIQNIFTEVQGVNCVPVLNSQNTLDDCGIFSLALGVDWALGHDPSHAIYDPHQMHSHLLDLLQSQRLERFPQAASSPSLTPANGALSQKESIATLPNGEDLSLQGHVSSAANQVISSANDTASKDNAKEKSATPSTATQQPVSVRTNGSYAAKCKFSSSFDDFTREVLYTVLVWSSPGWDQKSDYEEYLRSRGIDIGNLDSTQIGQLNSQNPRNTWDTDLIYSLIKMSRSLAGNDNSKWSAKIGTNPERSLTILKDLRNDLAMSGEIGRKECIALVRRVRRLTKRIQTGLKWVRRHRPGPIASFQKSEINQKFKDLLTSIDNISNAAPELETSDRHAKQLLQLEKNKEIIKKRLPQLKTYLRKFTTFSPFAKSLEPFSGGNVQVKDMYTEMVLEGKDSHRIRFENLLDHLSHGDRGCLLLIKGHAGIGKSAVVRKLVSDWLDKAGFIKDLDSYDLVFHAECRDHIESFRDLLVTSLGGVHELLDDKDLIATILAFKCLIIMDGYDELNKKSSKLVKEVLTLKRSNKFSLIFTSRPEAEKKFDNQVHLHFKTVTKIRLDGIPKENLQDFVKYYHNSINSDPSQTIDGLLKYLEKTKYKMSGTWKSPYNISILVILWTLGQDVNDISTEAELHMKMFNLQNSRLEEYLQKDESTKSLPQSVLCEKLEKFLWHLSEQALTGLKNDDIILSQSTYKELTRISNELDLPAEQLLGAFLKELTGTSEKHYGFPHKATQEFFGAYNIILQVAEKIDPNKDEEVKAEVESQDDETSFLSILMQMLCPCFPCFKPATDTEALVRTTAPAPARAPGRALNLPDPTRANNLRDLIRADDRPHRARSTNRRDQTHLANDKDPNEATDKKSLRDIFKDLHPEDSYVSLAKYQNLLCNIISISSEIADRKVPKSFLFDALNLLKDSGLYYKESWIRILNNIKCNEPVANWIAAKFRLLEGEIKINDYSFDAYLAILKAMKKPLRKKIFIDMEMNEVPQTLEDLAKLIVRYSPRLEIKDLIFPELLDGRSSLQEDYLERALRPLIQDVRLRYFGIWRKTFNLTRRDQEERWKYLKVKVDDPEALKDLYGKIQTVNLYELKICLSADFGPTDEALPIPTHGIHETTFVNLELQDVKDFEDVKRIVKALHPKKNKTLIPYNGIYFRRLCPLDEEGIFSLLEAMRGFRVKFEVVLPTSVCPSSLSSQKKIETKAKKTIGCLRFLWEDYLNT